MRRITPLTLVALMLLQTLAMGIGAPVSAADARGGQNDDWKVVRITLGNASSSAEVWTQSNGTTLEYLFEGDNIEIGMEIQRTGGSFSAKKLRRYDSDYSSNRLCNGDLCLDFW